MKKNGFVSFTKFFLDFMFFFRHTGRGHSSLYAETGGKILFGGNREAVYSDAGHLWDIGNMRSYHSLQSEKDDADSDRKKLLCQRQHEKP